MSVPGRTGHVHADDAYNQGVLTAAPGSVNDGAILLGLTSAYWGQFPGRRRLPA